MISGRKREERENQSEAAMWAWVACVLSYRDHFHLLSCEGKLISMMAPNDPPAIRGHPSSSSRPAPRREVCKIHTNFLPVRSGHRVGRRNDSDAPTHTLVPCWMPSPMG